MYVIIVNKLDYFDTYISHTLIGFNFSLIQCTTVLFDVLFFQIPSDLFIRLINIFEKSPLSLLDDFPRRKQLATLVFTF